MLFDVTILLLAVLCGCDMVSANDILIVENRHDLGHYTVDFTATPTPPDTVIIRFCTFSTLWIKNPPTRGANITIQNVSITSSREDLGDGATNPTSLSVSCSQGMDSKGETHLDGAIFHLYGVVIPPSAGAADAFRFDCRTRNSILSLEHSTIHGSSQGVAFVGQYETPRPWTITDSRFSSNGYLALKIEAAVYGAHFVINRTSLVMIYFSGSARSGSGRCHALDAHASASRGIPSSITIDQSQLIAYGQNVDVEAAHVNTHSGLGCIRILRSTVYAGCAAPGSASCSSSGYATAIRLGPQYAEIADSNLTAISRSAATGLHLVTGGSDYSAQTIVSGNLITLLGQGSSSPMRVVDVDRLTQGFLWVYANRIVFPFSTLTTLAALQAVDADDHVIIDTSGESSSRAGNIALVDNTLALPPRTIYTNLTSGAVLLSQPIARMRSTRSGSSSVETICDSQSAMPSAVITYLDLSTILVCSASDSPAFTSAVAALADAASQCTDGANRVQQIFNSAARLPVPTRPPAPPSWNGGGGGGSGSNNNASGNEEDDGSSSSATIIVALVLVSVVLLILAGVGFAVACYFFLRSKKKEEDTTTDNDDEMHHHGPHDVIPVERRGGDVNGGVLDPPAYPPHSVVAMGVVVDDGPAPNSGDQL